MAKQLDLKGRNFWIMSEPHGPGWKAVVVEVGPDQAQEDVGIDATAETRPGGGGGRRREAPRVVSSVLGADRRFEGGPLAWLAAQRAARTTANAPRRHNTSTRNRFSRSSATSTSNGTKTSSRRHARSRPRAVAGPSARRHCRGPRS